MEFTKNLKEAEEFDNFKTKVLKYVLYKKRTEMEVREKFKDYEISKLEDVIDFLKEYKYIDDIDYIKRSIEEFKTLKNFSLKEIKYKLIQKGIDKSLLDDYIYSHNDELLDYEIKSAKNIILKKNINMEIEEIKSFLYKKGYMSDSIKIAIEEI
mgnify:CR=1 FL=1